MSPRASLWNTDETTLVEWTFEFFFLMQVDWNDVLKIFQEQWDKQVEGSDDFGLVSKRTTELRITFEQECRRGQIASARRTLTKLTGFHAVDRSPYSYNVFWNRYSFAQDWNLPKLGYAMRIYRDEHGRYPTRFEELLGKYLSEIPLDRVTKGPIRQTKKDGHIVLYTIAQERPDDGKILLSDRTLTLPK